MKSIRNTEGNSDGLHKIRAATIDRYGLAESIKVEPIERPRCGDGEALVEIRAASVNPYDWHTMSGTPWLMRMGNGIIAPKSRQLGIDCSGVVTAVGTNTKRLSVGDEVFGFGIGTFAEYARAKEESLAHKPAGVSFEEAAAVGVAALTALQGVRDHGRIQQGQHVLINGASGGVGTYAIQLARHFGAEVTGVCSAGNHDLIRALGADHAIDYATEDFTTDEYGYDVIFDLVGNRRLSHLKRCLKRSGIYVVGSGPKKNKVFGPVWHMLKSLIAFKFGTRRAFAFIAEQSSSDLEFIGNLLASEEIRSVVNSEYELDAISEAMQSIEFGHTTGKIVVCP